MPHSHPTLRLMLNYNLQVNSVLAPQLISSFLNSFWVEVFKPINKRGNNHLLMIVKVCFEDSAEGFKTITPMRRVNYADRKLYIEYVINRLGILSDSYSSAAATQPISEIFIEYIEQVGPASNTEQNLQVAEYTVKALAAVR